MFQTQHFYDIKSIGDFQYSLQNKLGSGNFGIVYKGINTKTQETIAMKIISRQKLNTSYLQQILQNEINSMKKVKHCKNVVRLIDVLETKNNIYIIQEYCNGGDLKLYSSRFQNHQIPQEQTNEIIRQILNGLLKLSQHGKKITFLHLFTNNNQNFQGIVHRDLKPENILIHNSVFKIADFGLSKSVENFQYQLLNSTLGTPLYMGQTLVKKKQQLFLAPQLLMAQPYTSKCDVWSLGVIFYELLCGNIPWFFCYYYQLLLKRNNPLNQFDLLQKIQEKKIKFPSKIQISSEIKQFILNCLQQSELKRYSFENIFAQSIFKNSFKYNEKLIKFGKKSKNIVKKLVMVIHNSGLFLDDVFKQTDKNNNDLLEFNELFNLLKQFEQLTREECEYIFNQFDINKDNKITFGEFKFMINQLAEQGKFDSIKISQQLVSQEKLKIQQIIQKQQIDLKLLFKKYDQNNTNKLSLIEFTKLIKELTPDLHEHQIMNLFQQFDLNKDGNLDLLEFYKALQSEKSRKRHIQRKTPCVTPRKYDQETTKTSQKKNIFIAIQQEKEIEKNKSQINQISNNQSINPNQNHKQQIQQQQGQFYYIQPNQIMPQNQLIAQKPVVQYVSFNNGNKVQIQSNQIQQPLVNYTTYYKLSPQKQYFH